MFNMIEKFFSPVREAERPAETGADKHKLLVATCALLLEMAGIDDEFSEEEQAGIMKILTEDLGLPLSDAREIEQTARKKLEAALDLWHFTNLINQNYSQEEKEQVMELVWRVVYADGTLDKHEDYLVHKIARLLNLQHRQMIEAKLRVLHGK